MDEIKNLENTRSEDLTFQDAYLKLLAWFKYIRSKWLSIFIVVLIAGAGGFFYADFFNKVTYTADLTFALEESQNNSGALTGALGLASTFGIDIAGSGSGGTFSGNNIIELMKTRRLVEQSLLTPYLDMNPAISLADKYIEVMGWQGSLGGKDRITFPVGVERQKLTRTQDSILGVIYKQMRSGQLDVLQVDKKVSFIRVSFKFPDEKFAKEFVSRLAKEVSDFYVKTKSLKSKQNVEILERQADSIKRELNQAIEGVAIANDNTYNLNPALNVKRAPSSRRQVDVQANTAILTELVKNLQIARITLMKETPLIQIIDEPILPLPKEGKKRLTTMILWSVFAGFLMIFYMVMRRVFLTLNLKINR